MKPFGKFGSRLVWLLALPLAGCCLAGSTASAADEAAAKKKAAEPEKHEKQIKVVVEGDDDEACCGGEGQIVLQVVDEGGHKKIIRKRIAGGKRAFLGVHLVGLTPELKKHYTGDDKTGVLIGKIEPDSPAAKAGIQVGDVLVSVDGAPADSALKIGDLIGDHKKGDKVKLGLVRDGKKIERVATLTEHERAFKRIGNTFIWRGDKGDFDFDLGDLGDLGDTLGEVIGDEVLQKLKDPALKERILMFKKQEQAQEKMEEKLRKMEERLRELEKKLQGKLLERKGAAEKTT